MRRLFPEALAGVFYAVLVLIMWGAFNPRSGLGYETAFPYMSELSWWTGFFYTSDPLRIYTSTFYHLSYLLSIAVHARGSYLPYQVVYALLWWSRGWLVFLLLRKFAGGQQALLSYLGGALVIVHSSDGAMQWVGQMNQFGFIFWMLLALYLLTHAYTSKNQSIGLPLLAGACFFEYMSLWSYESQLLIILTYPAALLLLKPGWVRWSALTAAWYLAPIYYLWKTINKYLQSSGTSYQESVLRTNWHPLSLASDWWFNIASSLEFWTWPREPNTSETLTAFLSIVAVLAFLAGGVILLRIVREQNGLDTRRLWVLLAAGSVLLALSFPVYLLLNSARSLWRTQFLSGIGSGLVWTAVIGLISFSFWKTKFNSAIVLILSAPIVYFGASSAIVKGQVHRKIWERHRAAIVRILHSVPSVEPGTVIVLTGVPKSEDPFGDNMWFDFAIRLSYPRIPVAGVYYYTDGTPSPSENMAAAGKGWKMTDIGMPTLVREADIANTVVVRWDGAITGSFPEFVCTSACAGERYNPANTITGPISPIAANRYRP